MLKVNTSSNMIALTRGDSAYIKLVIQDSDGNVHELQENEVVTCYFRDQPNTGTLLFEGEIVRNVNEEVADENGIVLLYIKPSDTAGKDVKKYYWDAQLTYTDSQDVYTFMSGTLKLMDEVTYDD